jgi:hypothetical protein
MVEGPRRLPRRLAQSFTALTAATTLVVGLATEASASSPLATQCHVEVTKMPFVNGNIAIAKVIQNCNDDLSGAGGRIGSQFLAADLESYGLFGWRNRDTAHTQSNGAGQIAVEPTAGCKGTRPTEYRVHVEAAAGRLDGVSATVIFDTDSLRLNCG